MNKIQKALRRLTSDERGMIKIIIKALRLERFEGLNVKRLRGCDNIFRVRKGKIRIIYQIINKKIIIIRIDRRKKDTYKF